MRGVPGCLQPFQGSCGLLTRDVLHVVFGKDRTIGLGIAERGRLQVINLTSLGPACLIRRRDGRFTCDVEEGQLCELSRLGRRRLHRRHARRDGLVVHDRYPALGRAFHAVAVAGTREERRPPAAFCAAF